MYIKGSNIYLPLKIVCYKPYRDLQLLQMPTYYGKKVFINFVTDFLLSVD